MNTFPHCSIPKFLKAEEFQKVKKRVLAQDYFRTSADLYEFERTKDFSHSLTLFTHALLLQKNWIKHYFHVKLGKRIDCAGFCYKPTDYLLPHDDRMPGRKIAYIYYLSSCTGGELAFYNTKNHQPTTIGKKIKPKANTHILFKVTKDSFHEVKEVMKGKRYSLAGWFYGD